jgi:hypothetical protein
MIVKDMPSPIFHILLQHYGDLEGYTKEYEEFLSNINTSQDDFELTQEFHALMKKREASEELKNLWQDDSDLWDRIVEKNATEEMKLMSEGLQKEPDTGIPPGDGDKDLLEAVADRAEKSQAKKKDGRKARPARGRVAQWRSIKKFYTKHGINPKWLLRDRCTYMMDYWNVPKKKKGDTRITPAYLRPAKLSSADSKWFALNKSAKHAVLQLQGLVAKSLYEVFGELKSDVEQPARKTDLKECSDGGEPQHRRSKRHQPEKVDFTLEDLGAETPKNMKYFLDTGILKQGMRPTHQALHLDNDIMKWDIAKRIWLGEEVSPEEWLKCGYVIDLPLSREGSWLRVAIPNAKTESFDMDWVFIPYGSFLIRSVALFHSGHYGNPGNTRFHATFSMENTSVHSDKLSYFRKLGVSQPDFAGWKLRWHPKVPEDCWGPDGYTRYTNQRVKNYKTYGTYYFDQVVWPAAKLNGLYLDILRNLSIYEKIPSDALKQEEKENDGEDVQSASCSGSISSEGEGEGEEEENDGEDVEYSGSSGSIE